MNALRSVLAALALCALGAPAGTAWTYDVTDAAAGPAHWAQLHPRNKACATVGGQSPINIEASEKDDSLEYLEFAYKASTIDLMNTGNMVKWAYAAGSDLIANGIEYELTHIEFHSPSEHHVRGMRFPLEMQLHHVSRDGFNDRAAVSVLIVEGGFNENLEMLHKVLPIDSLDQVSVGNGNTTVFVQDWLPKDHRYYTYPGSLTSPPCTEKVDWFVLREFVQAAPAQLDAFTSTVRVSARGGQPLGDRVVKRYNGPNGPDYRTARPEDEIDIPGPRGPTGADGRRGKRGKRGPQGDRGPQGPDGLAGKNATDGARGPRGERGQRGVRGTTGVPGADGRDGVRGPRGDQGDRGDAGKPGRDVTGPVGPRGNKGKDRTGARGDQGDRGDRGPAGDAGDAGPRGPAGPAGPAGQAKPGDVGPAGKQGPKGPTGLEGVKGPDGPRGERGEPGVRGPIGPEGKEGDAGLPGPVGPGWDRSGTYGQVIAESICVDMSSKTGWTFAVQKPCPGKTAADSCSAICATYAKDGQVKSTTCAGTLHIYANEPFSASGKLGLKTYNYMSGCDYVGCGPNYCCCQS